jgi:4-azaleucine resistance transporter AzlC
MHSLAGFRAGCRAATPVILGYLPIAVAYGVLARQAGISPLMTVLMSVMVFAGSSQFIGVSMIGSGASSGLIIMTTFLVNLRHMLMSASLSPYYCKFAKKWLPILAFGLTDETFALASTAFREQPRDEGYVFGLQLASYLSWVTGSLLGAVLAGTLTAVSTLGFEFVLYAMFIFLLVMQLSDHKMLLVALFSGGAALMGAKFLPGHWFIILATILGATLGVFLEDGRKTGAAVFGDGPGDISS